MTTEANTTLLTETEVAEIATRPASLSTKLRDVVLMTPEERDALCRTIQALRTEIVTSDQEWQARIAEVERERNELRAELNSSAESIINEAGKVGQLMDLASANAVKESLDCAIELCKAKAEGYRKSAEGNLARETWMDRADVMDGFARELEQLK